MHVSTPSSLSPDALARRLTELVADERGALVDFLLHLEEFDRRRAWAEAGYDSLWTYCQRVLHLREGPAGRRIAAMRVVREFPRLADALRDGRLCLSTVTLLAPLLREESLDEVVARAAYRTKAEVEHLGASLMPRDAPRDGIRRLPERRVSAEAPPPAAVVPENAVLAAVLPAPGVDAAVSPARELLAEALSPAPSLSHAAAGASSRADARPQARATVTPVAADAFSLRVTVDAALKAEIDELTALLSHKVPNGDLAAVLREAVQCALEKHGRRRGARPPVRERAPRPKQPLAPEKASTEEQAEASASKSAAREPPRERDRPHVPAHIRREVWKRDGGRCTWRGPDGHRCESRWRLEFDHVTSVALGGATTAGDLRLVCRTHNQLHAEQVFGAEHMAKFRRDVPEPVRSLILGSATGAPG